MTNPDNHEVKKEPVGETLEDIRHNYSLKAPSNESDDNTIGGLLIKNHGWRESSVQAKQKSNNSISDMLMISAISNDLYAFENLMEKKYGEDFDLHLAAEFLDDETYEKLASIKDIDERREAVSQAIEEGINNGTIDPEEVKAFNPDFQNWIEVRSNERAQTLEKALKHEQNQDLKSQQESTFAAENNNQLEQGLDNMFSMKGPSM